MLKWRLKACARCNGDVYIDRDMDGWFEQCLQCSYRRELKDIKDFKKTTIAVADQEDWSKDDD